MSKGFGKIQRAVLDHLAAAERWCWLADVVRGCHTGQGDPPRSLTTSVARAVRGLEDRGLLFAGIPLARERLADAGKRKACWLPGQQPPALKPSLSSATVEEFIVGSLAAGEFDWYDRMYHRHRGGWLSYEWFTEQGRRRLAHGRDDDARVYAALKRAVARLSTSGVIEQGRNQEGRLYLRMCCAERKKPSRATLGGEGEPERPAAEAEPPAPTRPAEG